MIKNAKMGREIHISVVNKIGVLADISSILAEAKINIEAVAGYAKEDRTAEILLVTRNNLHAVSTLKKNGYKAIGEREIIAIDLEDKPGRLKEITQRLEAEDIDIKYIYGTTCTAGCPAKLIISTNKNATALKALKK